METVGLLVTLILAKVGKKVAVIAVANNSNATNVMGRDNWKEPRNE